MKWSSPPSARSCTPAPATKAATPTSACGYANLKPGTGCSQPSPSTSSAASRTAFSHPGVRFVNVPTRVTYPQDGISHFKALRDNVLISQMHARLFFGMLLRLPVLMWRRVAA